MTTMIYLPLEQELGHPRKAVEIEVEVDDPHLDSIFPWDKNALCWTKKQSNCEVVRLGKIPLLDFPLPTVGKQLKSFLGTV